MLHIAGLTIDNVRKALHGIHWREVGWMLYIPDSKLSEIEGKYRSDEEREVAVIRYWILRDPFASWRRIIDQLEKLGKHDHAVSLYHYSEELTGSTNHTSRALTIHLMHTNYYIVHVYILVCVLHVCLVCMLHVHVNDYARAYRSGKYTNIHTHTHTHTHTRTHMHTHTY